MWFEVFRACRSRRGDKGRNDRIFLEALHYFSVHNITWRALPAAFGNWNQVWKRFWRLSQAGVFEAFFDALAATSRTAHLVQMFNSTVVRAHVSAAGAKGGRMARRWAARVGASRPRSTSRSDLDGLPLAFHLTEGQASDSPQFEVLLDLGPDITPRAAVGDKGYDSQSQSLSRARARHLPGDPVQVIGPEPAGHTDSRYWVMSLPPWQNGGCAGSGAGTSSTNRFGRIDRSPQHSSPGAASSATTASPDAVVRGDDPSRRSTARLTFTR